MKRSWAIPPNTKDPNCWTTPIPAQPIFQDWYKKVSGIRHVSILVPQKIVVLIAGSHPLFMTLSQRNAETAQ